jgi:hypothetical protein
MKNIMLWARRYVTIYGIIMLCTFFMCLLFNPTSELPVVSYFGRILVFTLLSLLSMVVYYSRDELTPKGWWLRTALHALLLEAMLLPLAHRWGFWYSGTDIIVYAAFILLAKALWHLVDYGISAGTAAKINERIRENRLEKRKEMIP